MKQIKSLIIQFLFVVVYLTIIVFISHLLLNYLNINNNIIHGIIYFPSFALICVYNDRVFKFYDNKKQAIIIIIPLLLLFCIVIFNL